MTQDIFSARTCFSIFAETCLHYSRSSFISRLHFCNSVLSDLLSSTLQSTSSDLFAGVSASNYHFSYTKHAQVIYLPTCLLWSHPAPLLQATHLSALSF